MRSVAQFALLMAAAFSARAEGFGPNLTVLLEFDNSPSASSLDEMKREVVHQMKPTGYRVDVKLKADIKPNEDFEDLVLVRLKGSCDIASMAKFLDERGPLAWTHTTEGEILPFSEVACDHIRRAVTGALWGGQKAKQDQLFGRALGRVVAHELYHIVYKTNVHNKGGVFKESLSGYQLIADELESGRRDDARKIVARWRR
jgi:hypothetical protein